METIAFYSSFLSDGSYMRWSDDLVHGRDNVDPPYYKCRLLMHCVVVFTIVEK